MKRLLLLLGLSFVIHASGATPASWQATLIEHKSSLQISNRDWETKRFQKGNDWKVLLPTAPPIPVSAGGARFPTPEEQPLLPMERGITTMVKLGPELVVHLKQDGDKITFKAVATIRQSEGAQKAEAWLFQEFSVREFFFTGSAAPGETIVVTSKGLHNDRKVSLVLIFTPEEK